MFFLRFSVSLILFFASLCYTAPPQYPNALALVDAQPDTKIIATLIKRDSELTALYQTVKDVTIFIAPDYTFPDQDLNQPPFTNVSAVRAVLQQVIVDGVHPTSSFTSHPQYLKSKLTNPDFINLSGGAAVARLVRLDNKNNALFGVGLSANVLANGSDLAFSGGLVQKISNPVNIPVSIEETADSPDSPIAPNYSLGNLSALGLLDSPLLGDINKRQDVTVFALTNEAFTAAFTEFLISKQCPSESILQSLKYYFIAPGVYYGDSFTGRKVQTLSGQTVELSGLEAFPKLKVNNVNVVTPDVFIPNGVIHILDNAISPSS